MLDDFVYGEVSRISPEAPAPVIAVQREEIVIGGAGNVARNIASLGANCMFVGVVGDDVAGSRVQGVAQENRKGIVPNLVADPSRPTTRKLRFVSEHFSTHLLRADWEVARPVDGKVETALIEHALKVLPRADAVVLSDYAKGVLTPKVIRAVIDRAKKLKKPVIVDPKGLDYSIYRGATLITPNRKELADAAHHPVDHPRPGRSRGEQAARALTGSKAVLVTLSEDGMLLQAKGRSPSMCRPIR